MNHPDKEQKHNPKVSSKLNSRNIDLPLVSIGVPTYNRPLGLRVALQCLVSQTYPNLEIIVSDNASPSDETRRVVQEFMAEDTRIKYVRQPENIGAIKNFQFVLERAAGVFFMWAADDDEWDTTFIDFCVRNIGESGSIMTAFQVKNRSQKNTKMLRLPPLSGKKEQRSDINAFVKNMQPSMFYGLHRRYLLSFFLEQEGFDWLDCYVCLRLIWNSGYICRNDVCLYTAGIDAEKYILKPFTGNRLNPLHYFIYSMKYILMARDTITLARHFAMLFLFYFRLAFPKR